MKKTMHIDHALRAQAKTACGAAIVGRHRLWTLNPRFAALAVEMGAAHLG